MEKVKKDNKISNNHKKYWIILSTIFICLNFMSCSNGKEYELFDTAMGTVVQEKIYGTEYASTELVATEILNEIQDLEVNFLSRRSELSQISQINQNTDLERAQHISEEMYFYLNKIWDISEKSNGALDVTVGPVVELWNIDACALGSGTFQIPSEEKLKKTMELVGYEKVSISENEIILPKGMIIDLGAVGKGIAGDSAFEILSQNENITGAILSIGGSIVTYGEKPDGTMWQIGIQNPRINEDEEKYIGTLCLSGNWFIATSGDYERYVEKDGKRYHHIIDPSTGCSAKSDVVSVTILSKEGFLSDALSTACFVLGKEEGFLLAKKYGVEILTIDKDGNIDMSEGMKQYFYP